MNRTTPKALRLDYLSFSRYSKLRNCLLSGAKLATVDQDFKGKETLNRGLVFGKFFHSQMEAFHELMSSEELSKAAVRNRYKEVLNQYEKKLANSAFFGYQGNISSWPEVNALYKALSRYFDQQLVSESRRAQRFSEKKLFGQNNQLEGRIDALIISDGEAEVIDYKSGNLEELEQPKSEHVEQLHFYAALVAEQFRVFPTKLSLVDYNLQTTIVIPDPRRSKEVVEDMLRVLANYNSEVERLDGVLQATPVAVACQHCERKKNCSAFWEQASELSLPNWAQSIKGKMVTPLTKNPSGGGSIEVEVDFGTVADVRIKVVGIFDARFPFVKNSLGKSLLFLDLRTKDGVSEYAEVTDRTVIIEYRDEDADEQ